MGHNIETNDFYTSITTRSVFSYYTISEFYENVLFVSTEASQLDNE